MQPPLTNLVLVMGGVPMWEGVWGLQPIIILGQNRLLYEKKTLPILSCLRGDAVVPLSRRAQSHSWIRAQAPYTSGTSPSPWAPAGLQGGSEPCCLYLGFPAIFYFLSVLGSPAFNALEASYSYFHFQEKQLLSEDEAGSTIPFTHSNKLSFPVIPRTMNPQSHTCWSCPCQNCPRDYS